jgi:hypothetical protein
VILEEEDTWMTPIKNYVTTGLLLKGNEEAMKSETEGNLVYCGGRDPLHEVILGQLL